MCRLDLPMQVRRKPAAKSNLGHERMKRLVTQLSTYVRADAGIPTRWEKVDLQRILLDALLEASHHSQGQTISIGAAEPVVILGDRHHLRQLFLILVDSALKHTPQSGTVEAALRQIGERVSVTIEDHGDGIRPEEILWVHELIDTEDPTRSMSHVDTGLSLTIAAWIVEQHGGGLSLANELGKGTKATVCLPVYCTGESLRQPVQAISRWPSAPSTN